MDTICGTGAAYPSGAPEVTSQPVVSRVRVAGSVVFCVVSWRSLFFFHSPGYCIVLIRFTDLITPLVSSNSFNKYAKQNCSGFTYVAIPESFHLFYCDICVLCNLIYYNYWYNVLSNNSRFISRILFTIIRSPGCVILRICVVIDQCVILLFLAFGNLIRCM
jgi:hypothetical protein